MISHNWILTLECLTMPWNPELGFATPTLDSALCSQLKPYLFYDQTH